MMLMLEQNEANLNAINLILQEYLQRCYTKS